MPNHIMASFILFDENSSCRDPLAERVERIHTKQNSVTIFLFSSIFWTISLYNLESNMSWRKLRILKQFECVRIEEV